MAGTRSGMKGDQATKECVTKVKRDIATGVIQNPGANKISTPAQQQAFCKTKPSFGP